jgi:hypothetical protein
MQEVSVMMMSEDEEDGVPMKDIEPKWAGSVLITLREREPYTLWYVVCILFFSFLSGGVGTSLGLPNILSYLHH